MVAFVDKLSERLGLAKGNAAAGEPATQNRPHVFMHIPKAGGTALISDLADALTPAKIARGLDKCLFGTFDGFDTMGEAMRASIFTDLAMIPRDADLVVGHMAASTLRATYPTGRFMTSLREPISRLMSYWTYWRSYTDADLEGSGSWGDIIRNGGRQKLASFLADPDLACQTDNVVTRMLLWPHKLIPDGDFIDPAHDEALLREARAKLRAFDFVDIVELPDRSALATWLGKKLGQSRANETKPVPAALRSQLHQELTPQALDRLDACSRLDLELWRLIGSDYLSPAELERIRAHTLLFTGARHAALLRNDC